MAALVAVMVATDAYSGRSDYSRQATATPTLEPSFTPTTTATKEPSPSPTRTRTPRSPRPTETLERAFVARVIDGDTMEFNGGTRVRYIGVDTPESTNSQDCFGFEATQFNAELVDGRWVELERDVSSTDQYGRTLRYVWIDGQMVNELLVAEGYATVSTYPPDVKYQARFVSAEREARSAGKGLWSECASDDGICDRAYPNVCIPPPPPNLFCEDIVERRFRVLAPDPHNFDGDRDGIGCER